MLAEAEIRAILETARDHGINHFDTAQDYGGGRSERMLGRVFGSANDVFIATKMHLVSPGEVAGRIDQSRKRLDRDVIDLLYIHWPRSNIDHRPVLEELERARANGRIRFIGVSNFTVEDLELSRQAARIDVLQLCYNLLWRFAEADVMPYCRKNGIALVSYSSLAQGLLSGGIDRRPPPDADDPRSETVYYDPGVWEHVRSGVEKLEEIAGRVPLSQIALRWITDSGNFASVLVGVSRMDQLEENIRAEAEDLSGVDFGRIRATSDAIHQHIPPIGNIFKYYP